jgi:hypothetical protein
MTRARLVCVVLATTTWAGCAKKPVEAPKELGEIGLFLFKHFEDEDKAEMSAGLLNLSGLIDTELKKDEKDQPVSMPILEGDNLGGLAIPDGVDAEAQVPRAVPGRSPHAIEDQLVTILEPNQVCIESDSTIWATREFLTDTACFEDASCDRLDVSQEVRKENFLAKVWYDQLKNYRRFDLEDEEGNIRKAIVGRSWIEKVFPADGGNNSWDQLFHLDVFIEDGGETQRWFSMWSSVTLGGVGDDLYGTLVVDGVKQAMVFGDEFISGNSESCPNDRDAEKPPRE